MKRLGAALLLAMVLVTAVGGTASAARYPRPSVEVTPGPGTTITGAHWCPSSTVSIYLDGVFQGTAETNNQGEFFFDLKLSEAIASGNHTVTVVGLESTCSEIVSANATITIAGGGTTIGLNAALPFTGSNISVSALLLVALMVVGAIALLAGRRRESTARGH